MSIVKGTFVAAALAFSSVTPALAGDGGREDGVAWLLNPGPVNAGPQIATQRATIARSRAAVRTTTTLRETPFQIARDMHMSAT